jgi:hypothetical protein
MEALLVGPLAGDHDREEAPTLEGQQLFDHERLGELRELPQHVGDRCR